MMPKDLYEGQEANSWNMEMTENYYSNVSGEPAHTNNKTLDTICTVEKLFCFYLSSECLHLRSTGHSFAKNKDTDKHLSLELKLQKKIHRIHHS